MGERGEVLITVVAIFLAAILMFVFPLVAISEMNDKEVLALVQSYTTEFVNLIMSKGEIEKEELDEFIQKLNSTGYSFEVDFEIQIADINPSKKEQSQQVGDSTYYSMFTPQVNEKLAASGSFKLKEGDYILVYVKITSPTMSQMFKAVLYGLTGDQSYLIFAQHSGLVFETGY